MAAAAENYQLRWDSHFTYLNSSVATLYKNEKFADVVLFSSSNASSAATSNVGISAHRFILSACSQFFSTMFENSSAHSPSGLLYVIMPPDLSFRTIQILIQYMYCGEATVSNDILSEVLKGGEMLKIRGLCRTTTNNLNSSSPPSAASTRNHRLPSHPLSTTPISKESHSLAKGSEVNNLRAIDIQFQDLEACVSPNNNIIVHKSQKSLPLGMISINKEVAIDPGYKRCNEKTTTPLLVTSSSSVCNITNCSSCPQSSEEDMEFLLNDHSHRMTRKSSIEQIRRESSEKLDCNSHITLQGSFEQPSPKPTGIKQEPSDWSTTGGCSDSHVEDTPLPNTQVTSITSPRPASFKSLFRPLAPVKIEADLSSSENDDAVDDGNDNLPEYKSLSHLVCEICNERCDDKKSWLRHMSSHRPELDSNIKTSPLTNSISKYCVPKKRIRTETPRATEHVTLQCDLCSIPFSSPGEWVRHIHSKHTELELAIYNNKTEQQKLQSVNERNAARARRKREATVIKQKPTALN